MLTLAFSLIIGSLVLGLIAFAFAGFNMIGAVKGEKPIGNMISGHIGAIICMAFFGITETIGWAVLIVWAVQKYTT